jgi:Cys-rich protein (TIGR01571 family)
MASASMKSGLLMIGGMFVGMMLLGLAGSMVVMSRFSSAGEIANDTYMGVRRLADELQSKAGMPRRAAGVQTNFGVVATTSTMPSSFDSSDGSSSSGSSLEPSKSSEMGSIRNSGPGLEQVDGVFIGSQVTGAVQLLIMIIFMVVYKQKAVDPVVQKLGTLDSRMANQPDADDDDFENGICDCFSDKWVCIHGLCCPMVRMAHTNAVAGILGYWETACCWCCCHIWTAGLGSMCLMVWFRMRLKQIMKLDDHPINDFCLTLFCPWLSICQQGTAVDAAMGYEVVGCCDLEYYDANYQNC